MKKIHIITIHHIHNFGSVLQAHALYKYLSNCGFEVDIIDYEPNYYNAGRNIIKTVVGRILNLKSYLARKKKYNSFIYQYSKISSKKIKTISGLKKWSLNYSNDIYISGGDQLWNNYHPCGNDDAYKLLFTNSEAKLSYGTSLGRSGFSDLELDALAKKVSQYKAIFLRESISVKEIKPFVACDCEHVIDPVGLLAIDYYKKIAIKPKMNKKYLVMYLAEKSDLLNEAVAYFKNQFDYEIVHICGFKKKCECDVFEKDVGPLELLGYILYSDFVLSASFHATMFSILLNKQFAAILPNEKTNARITDILAYFNMSDRILDSKETITYVANNMINFEKTNSLIDYFREKSTNLLISKIKELIPDENNIPVE